LPVIDKVKKSTLHSPRFPIRFKGDWKRKIRNVRDFPKRGIVFRDITTLLKDAEAFRAAVDQLAIRARRSKVDIVAGVEARGFVLGAALAYKLGVGFVPLRKPGKLPATVEREEYALEYGTDVLEIHKDAVRKGQRVLIVDDLLATGGTARAAARLVEKLGGQVVGLFFLVELTFLKGRDKLKGREAYALISYDSE
jgi:adenine phosphoribosyltransferase